MGTDFEKFRRWSILSLLNLLFVSLLGVLLRYKIVLPLPGVNYKFLLHAHSHFAFSGWISTALFTALLYILFRSGGRVGKIYTYLFWLAQIASFGMLLSFPFQGYGPVSIFFSVLSIFFSWGFTWQYVKDMGKCGLSLSIQRWIKAALFFFIVSGAGPFLLAYIMSHKLVAPDLYYNAVYLFLHFQYNGWFSFGVLALFFFVEAHYGLSLEGKIRRIFFRLMAAACIPAYCLSLLWMNPPVWVFVIAALAACLQLSALVVFLLMVRSSWSDWSLLLPLQVKLFWGLSFLAFMIKLVLQALSVIPVLGRFAFGFRPVIVGYLHLVTLGFLSFFLVGFFIMEKLFNTGSAVWKKGCGIFVAGVLLNEFVLLIQSIWAVFGNSLPAAPFLLFAAAAIIFAGVVLMLIPQIRRRPL